MAKLLATIEIHQLGERRFFARMQLPGAGEYITPSEGCDVWQTRRALMDHLGEVLWRKTNGS